MNRLILVIVLCLTLNGLFAQGFKLTNDTTYLYQLLDSLSGVENPDSTTLNYYLEICPIIYKVNNKQAQIHCEKTLKLALSLKIDKKIVLANLYSAFNYIESANFKKALDHLYKSREMLNSLDDDLLKAQLELYQGLFFLNQTAYEEAKNRFQISLNYLKKHPVNRMIGANYNNLGVSFLEEGVYDSANYYFDRALSVESYVKNQSDSALVLMNIGSTKIGLGAYDEALKKLLNANIIYKKNHTSRLLAINESLIARAFRLQKRYDSVITHLNAAIYYSKIIQSPKKMMLAYEEYTKYYLDINEPGYAVSLLLMYNELKDSVINITKYDENQQIITRFENESREKELKLQEQSIELLKNKSLINQLIILILIVTVILTVLTLVFIRNRVKKNKLLSEKEKRIQVIELNNLKKDLDFKSRELTTTALEIIKKNDFITSHKKKLEELEKTMCQDDRIKLFKIRKSLDNAAEVSKDWEEFNIIFEQVHQGFFSKLKEICPEISPAELKLAALLKLNISSKRISDILGNSSESVRTARSRLRKKLGLSRDANLVDFMINVG